MQTQTSPTQDATNTVSKVYLKDYQPPNFTITHVNLTIQLYDDHAIVTSYLDVQAVTAMEMATDIAKPQSLCLYGRELQLLQISIDDQVLAETDYQLDAEQLTILDVPSRCRVMTKVRICPQQNTSLEGLYLASDAKTSNADTNTDTDADNTDAAQADIMADTMYVTQCEPEGFRKITFYPDRPDILAEFTTRLEADCTFPTLLANGNLMESGVLPEDAENNERHYAVWHDPTKKPSYLFACVFADLAVMQDAFTTSEGREVLLEIYAKPHNIDKCQLAMQALKDAMLWDEVNYGRAYDLDRYMIVAVSQFNMGAMENKGLNIFNTACVLSSPQTTTDVRSFGVKAIIAHEYFHNWTGNRITCRDWFQLCLKEGFTVYRDQSFSADQQSASVQRIDDVGLLRAHQFAEDAGPLAHPVRPESFVEINNFYTTTVYEKGAEIVRMIANMMGKDKFRQGTDEYFKRYDGQAVTVEDFLSALSSADARVADFITWYRQPGTPVVQASIDYAQHDHTLSIDIELQQQHRHVAGYPEPQALPIPVAAAAFDRNTGEIIAEDMLMLTNSSQTFTLEFDVPATEQAAIKPVISLLRDFSAPVVLTVDYSADELAFLIEHETNGFNRWQATQMLVNKLLQQQMTALMGASNTDAKDASDKSNAQQAESNDSYQAAYISALSASLPKLATTDSMLAARLFDIPSERELATTITQNYQPDLIKTARAELKHSLATALQPLLNKTYQVVMPLLNDADDAVARGNRALANVLLDLLTFVTDEQMPAQTDKVDLCCSQYEQATTMTQRLGALRSMVNYQLPTATQYLQDFYQRFEDDPLVLDMWFAVQAGAYEVDIQQVEQLLEHPKFDWGTPNRIRAVVGGLASRPAGLWTEQGLTLYTHVVAKLDASNPVLASRLLNAVSRWYTLNDEIKTIAHNKLSSLRGQVASKNVIESLENTLAATA